MKSEIQIAEGFLKLRHRFVVSACHKETCQRFLEFLEEEMKRWETLNELSDAYISTGELEEKITDLKQAIKLYEDAGI